MDGFEAVGGDEDGDGSGYAPESTGGNNDIVEIDSQEFLESTIIQDFTMTSRSGFESLKKDLVLKFARKHS